MRRYYRGVRFGTDPDLERVGKMLAEADKLSLKLKGAYQIALNSADAYYKRKPANSFMREVIARLNKALEEVSDSEYYAKQTDFSLQGAEKWQAKY